jgi:hypothetical protein
MFKQGDGVTWHRVVCYAAEWLLVAACYTVTTVRPVGYASLGHKLKAK